MVQVIAPGPSQVKDDSPNVSFPYPADGRGDMNRPPSNAACSVFDLVELVGGRRGSGVVGVFVCYLDDSDHNLSSVATVAGYLAHLDQWKNSRKKLSQS